MHGFDPQGGLETALFYPSYLSYLSYPSYLS
jgi:hypothetical protein